MALRVKKTASLAARLVASGLLSVFLTIPQEIRGTGKGAALPPISSLPLVHMLPAQWRGDSFIVLISGDGGWTKIDQRLGRFFTGQGIGVAGLDSKKYFGKKRSPEETSLALQAILNHYSHTWHKEKVILIGYSRGACVLPFMANRLPAAWLDRARLIALLGLFSKEEFKIHVLGHLRLPQKQKGMPVLPELEKLRGRKLLCVCGEEEKKPFCDQLPAGLVKVIRLPGHHHFGGQYEQLGAIILREAQ